MLKTNMIVTTKQDFMKLPKGTYLVIVQGREDSLPVFAIADLGENSQGKPMFFADGKFDFDIEYLTAYRPLDLKSVDYVETFDEQT